MTNQLNGHWNNHLLQPYHHIAATHLHLLGEQRLGILSVGKLPGQTWRPTTYVEFNTNPSLYSSGADTMWTFEQVSLCTMYFSSPHKTFHHWGGWRYWSALVFCWFGSVRTYELPPAEPWLPRCQENVGQSQLRAPGEQLIQTLFPHRKSGLCWCPVSEPGKGQNLINLEC